MIKGNTITVDIELPEGTAGDIINALAGGDDEDAGLDVGPVSLQQLATVCPDIEEHLVEVILISVIRRMRVGNWVTPNLGKELAHRHIEGSEILTSTDWQNVETNDPVTTETAVLAMTSHLLESVVSNEDDEAEFTDEMLHEVLRIPGVSDLVVGSINDQVTEMLYVADAPIDAESVDDEQKEAMLEIFQRISD